MYALGLVLGLIALVLILRDIEVGFAALVGVVTLLPFAAVPLNIGFKPTFLDLVVLALFGVWLLERATGKLGESKKNSQRESRLETNRGDKRSGVRQASGTNPWAAKRAEQFVGAVRDEHCGERNAQHSEPGARRS